jgi:hypothetical protein
MSDDRFEVRESTGLDGFNQPCKTWDVVEKSSGVVKEANMPSRGAAGRLHDYHESVAAENANKRRLIF